MNKNIVHLNTRRAEAPRKASDASPYHIYLNSLAKSGRKPIATQLGLACQIWGYNKPAELFHWSSLNFEKAHQVRSSMLELDYAVNSINLTLSALRGVTKTAFNLGQISGDEMLRINAVKNVKGSATRTGRKISRTEIKALLKACSKLDNPRKSAREKAILLVGTGGGLRCQEICDLNIEDINRETGSLIIRKGKGRKQRQLFLAKTIITALERWITSRGEQKGPLFNRFNKEGYVTSEPMKPNGVAYALRALQEISATQPFTPHDMRRTFITHLLELGTDINTVRQLAGHSDISTTAGYDKRDQEWQRNASRGITFQ